MQSTSWEMLGWMKHKLESGLPGEISIKKNRCFSREKEMATHSNILAWRILWTEEPVWAAVYGVAQSQTWQKWLGSSSSKNIPVCCDLHKGFGIINKAEVGVFLVFFCFFNDPTDFGNLISGSSAFSKSSLNIWKFKVHILLKPGL